MRWEVPPKGYTLRIIWVMRHKAVLNSTEEAPVPHDGDIQMWVKPRLNNMDKQELVET